MDKSTRGLVLREVAYKEADKILTVLTEDLGKITVSARGARGKMGKCTAASQLLAFSELELYQRHGRWSLREGRVVELFENLRQDIEALSTGVYFAELLEAVSDMDYVAPDLLPLGLTGLLMLTKGERDRTLVKAAFELRLMCLAGYAPEISACPKCGETTPAEPLLQLNGGHIRCKTCPSEGGGGDVPLDGGSLSALRHIASAPLSRVFAFTLGEGGATRLKTAAEGYVLAQLERNFRSLDFLKSLHNAY